MKKIRQIIQLYRNMGGRYIAFRTWYELSRKTGLLKWKFPTSPALQSFITLAEWRESSTPFFFRSRESININKVCDEQLKIDAQRIFNGEIQFFSHEWKNLGKDYDWITNPCTGYHYDIQKHWTEVEDLNAEAGDIKYTWEKSRFSYLFTIMRYDYHFDEDHAEMVFHEIIDWIKKNPVNQGPNYKCSQEISLRILNWTFALYFYRNSDQLTDEVFQQVINSIYWQICHVRRNINFSRISVRNNHSITETLTLYLSSLLYPFFPDVEERKKKGKSWFEEEIDYQIYEDGTFLQYSMNYHRVVIQLLTWAIGLAELNDERFKDVVYEKAYKSVNFLYQCQEDSNGWLPNYGSNDGALFFRLSQNDYRDFRPQLDALHQMLTGIQLYQNDFEDKGWYGISLNRYPAVKKKYGCISFPKSGYYLIRESDTLSFVHCGDYKDRPAHADNMHIDIWFKGENVLLDAGSYKYNTTPSLIKFFNGTESHNTVMLDDYDQMQKGGRFIWYYWPKHSYGSLREENDSFIFEGRVNVYRQLAEDIFHVRKIEKKKGLAVWVITDVIEKKPISMMMRQLWHSCSDRLKIESGSMPIKSEGWLSVYYGVKTTCRQLCFESKGNKITTTIRIES